MPSARVMPQMAARNTTDVPARNTTDVPASDWNYVYSAKHQKHIVQRVARP